jgi:methylase of polypeptide subunit release factors
MTGHDERDARVEFAGRYAIPTGDVNARIEHEVIGAVWGANGYTTLEQADELAKRLDLAPGRRLLDVGTGRGWPGVYFAKGTGCDVIGTDMPFEPLAIAKRRASAEGLSGRAWFSVAAGADQPFRPASFDAIVHTDVLC